MKIYTTQEATTMIRTNPILYTEIAHDYPCCNLPQKKNCDKCEIEYCPIKVKAQDE